MGCSQRYSPPIVIPQGLPGTNGSGSPGVDGESVLSNSIGTTYTVAAPTDASFTSYTLRANTVAAKDILEIEAYITVPPAYVGDLYLNIGAFTVVNYSIGTKSITPPTAVNGAVILKAKVLVKTTGVLHILPETKLSGIPDTTITHIMQIKSIDTTSNVLIDVRAGSVTGTASCLYLIVKQAKSV